MFTHTFINDNTHSFILDTLILLLCPRIYANLTWCEILHLLNVNKIYLLFCFLVYFSPAVIICGIKFKILRYSFPPLVMQWQHPPLLSQRYGVCLTWQARQSPIQRYSLCFQDFAYAYIIDWFLKNFQDCWVQQIIQGALNKVIMIHVSTSNGRTYHFL